MLGYVFVQNLSSVFLVSAPLIDVYYMSNFHTSYDGC